MNDKCPSYDIEIEQGANFYWIVEYYDKIDGVETPVDLTGYDAVMQIRKTPNSDLMDEYSVSNGIITFDEENGKIIINAPAADTEAYEDDFKGVYDIKLTSPSGFVERLVRGSAVVSAEVTQ